jgi:hypothetical protein
LGSQDDFHEASNPASNRSAKEAWGVAGIRITLSSDLQITTAHASGPELGSNFDDLPTVSRNWQSLNLAISWHPLLGTRQARAISLSS